MTTISINPSQINPQISFELRNLFKAVPKTELHLHIGGSTRKEDIKIFMKENGVPEDDIPKLMKLIKPTYENITDILDTYDKVPKHVHTSSQFKAVEEGLKEGSDWVKENHGYNMKSYLTVLAQRFGTPEDSLKTAKLAIAFAKRPHSMIHGFDLAGDESKHSIEHHKE